MTIENFNSFHFCFTHTDSDSTLQTCPAGSVPCDTTSDKCGVLCDMRRDCPNNEDEIGCS